MKEYINMLQEAQAHIKRNAIIYAAGYLPIMMFVMWTIRTFIVTSYSFSDMFSFGEYSNTQFSLPSFTLFVGIGLAVSILIIIPVGLKLYKAKK